MYRGKKAKNDAQKSGFDKKALTTELKKKGLTEDEIMSKVEAIVAVLES